MSAIAIIPIKSISKRVPGKNFKNFAGNPLYKYIISSAVKADCFDSIYVDTDSDEIKSYVSALGLNVFDRLPAMTADTVNGNDLLVYQASKIKEGELIFQLFATAPLLLPETIKECVNKLKADQNADSIFTATEEYGFFWWQNQPVNYRPSLLPRSQDLVPVVKETTGLYGIARSSVEKYAERIGAKPIIHLVDPEQALDIDTDFDFRFAEAVAKKRNITCIQPEKESASAAKIRVTA